MNFIPILLIPLPRNFIVGAAWLLLSIYWAYLAFSSSDLQLRMKLIAAAHLFKTGGNSK